MNGARTGTARCAVALFVALAVLVCLAVSGAYAVSHVRRLAKAKSLAAAKSTQQQVLQAAAVEDAQWVQLPKPNNDNVNPGPYAATDNTDGQMHWLRQYWADIIQHGPPHGSPGSQGVLAVQAAVLAVGDVGIAVNGNTHGAYHIHPQANPQFRHAEMAAYAAVSNGDRAFADAHAGNLAGLNVAQLVAVPQWQGPDVAKYQHCSASVVSALIARGRALNNALQWPALLNDAGLANLGYAAVFGGAPACTITGTLQAVKAYLAVAAAFVGHNALAQAVEPHYARFRGLLGANYDIWELRGWLYATDRANGHRLVGATGYAADTPCARTPTTAWEMAQLQKRFNNAGGGGPRPWGFDHDTIGHVRPQAMGGDRDPLNFLPQSNAGQKMMQPAESFALEIAKHCGNNHARYTVIYTYGGNGALDRRPTQARTVVDVLQTCNARPEFGGVTLVAGERFNKLWVTF